MTILTTPDSIVDSVPTDLWVGGRQTPASTGATFPVHTPRPAASSPHVADASPDDGRRALDLASRTQAQWAATAPRGARWMMPARRLRVGAQAQRGLRDRHDTRDGQGIGEARSEVAYGAEYLRWFAEEAVRVGGRFGAAPGGQRTDLVTKVPVGPVLAITPWNFRWPWEPARSRRPSRRDARSSSSGRGGDTPDDAAAR
ncbi:aldehyde dehydrogenase family protein [Rhodococcus hoagii]|nr:aldehyde dehydrogenase family protein [Prescottella equi]